MGFCRFLFFIELEIRISLIELISAGGADTISPLGICLAYAIVQGIKRPRDKQSSGYYRVSRNFYVGLIQLARY